MEFKYTLELNKVIWRVSIKDKQLTIVLPYNKLVRILQFLRTFVMLTPQNGEKKSAELKHNSESETGTRWLPSYKQAQSELCKTLQYSILCWLACCCCR